MKNKIVLIILFVLPIVVYLIFATAKHNSMFLPKIKKASELPINWQNNESDVVKLKDKITILGFPGKNIINNKPNFFNLNQKIYNKYKDFHDFQMVMIVPFGCEAQVNKVMNDFSRITGKSMNKWKFIFAKPEEIATYFKTFNFKNSLDENLGTTLVYIIDKDVYLRGRSGKNKKGTEEYKESYNTISAAELHNEMTDDVKILLREYRLALKKNKDLKRNK